MVSISPVQSSPLGVSVTLTGDPVSYKVGGTNGIETKTVTIAAGMSSAMVNTATATAAAGGFGTITAEINTSANYALFGVNMNTAVRLCQ